MNDVLSFSSELLNLIVVLFAQRFQALLGKPIDIILHLGVGRGNFRNQALPAP